MKSTDTTHMSRSDRSRMSHGYSFAAGVISKANKKGSHTHGGHSQAARGWSCDEPPNKTTKEVPGWARVDMPKNHIRFTRPASEPRRSPVNR